MKKEKIFMLYLKTGGGHLAPAKAVAEWLQENSPEAVEPMLIDGFTKTNRYIKTIVEDGYRVSQNKAKWVFEALYAVNKIKHFAEMSTDSVCKYTEDYIKELIIAENPDKIMVFHFFLIKPVYKVLKELGLSIPVYTVVTDPYSAPKMWFLEPNQHYIVFSEKLKAKIIEKAGNEKPNVDVVPFVVNKKFEQMMSEEKKDDFKKQFGLDNGKSTTLIMGGGDGIPKGKRILRKIIESSVDTNIIIVAGKNKGLKRDADKLALEHLDRNIIVLGFVDYVYELLNVSDVVITKCGASTFMEILLCGKIPVISTYLWEQEKGNVDFVMDNHLGIYQKRTSKIPQLLHDIISNPEVKNEYVHNIENQHLMNGAEMLSKLILK